MIWVICCMEISYVQIWGCFAKQTGRHIMAPGKALKKKYVSSEQYCSESWSPWTVGKMKGKFIIISLCGHIYSVELHKYYFGISELKGTERGGKTHKYLMKCLPCSYLKVWFYSSLVFFPVCQRTCKGDKFIVYLPAYFLFFFFFLSLAALWGLHNIQYLHSWINPGKLWKLPRMYVAWKLQGGRSLSWLLLFLLVCLFVFLFLLLHIYSGTQVSACRIPHCCYTHYWKMNIHLHLQNGI